MHAVALETEHRQNECLIGRGEDVLELARSDPLLPQPTSMGHWFHPAVAGPMPPSKPQTCSLEFKRGERVGATRLFKTVTTSAAT